MLSISIGPVAMPVAPLLLLLAFAFASWLAARLAGKEHAAAAGNTLFNAALLGLLAARVTHLVLNADLYAATPWSAFDLRDGGWNGTGGLLAAGAWLGWRATRTPLLRRPLAIATAAGVLAWVVASTALGVRDAPALPALTVHELASAAPVELSQLARGRPVVINLWASWCAPCREEMPLLARAQQREATVRFLFVNQGEPAAAVRAYLDEQKLPLHDVLLDPGSRLAPAVGSRGLPTTLFYDADGRRVDAHFGVLNEAALERRLRQLRPAH